MNAHRMHCARQTPQSPWQVYQDKRFGNIVPPDVRDAIAAPNVCQADREMHTLAGAAEARLMFEGGCWTLDGDGDPALVLDDASEIWMRRGVIHRDGDLPAVKDGDNWCYWYRNGRLHREGGEPAIISATVKCWYRDGELHRDNDLPAHVTETYESWYMAGKPHRENRPSLIQANETLCWHLYGEDKTADVEALIRELRAGGAVISILDRSQVTPGTSFQLQTVAGGEVIGPSVRYIASAGWLRWIVDHRDDMYPELAAAMRGRQMRESMAARTATTQSSRNCRAKQPVLV